MVRGRGVVREGWDDEGSGEGGGGDCEGEREGGG